MTPIKQVVNHYFIWGMGLLGTSVALDLKKKGHRVFGCENSPKNRKVLLKMGFSQVFPAKDTENISKAFALCDGIIIATPIDSVYEILREISCLQRKPSAWITDMSSTKTGLMDRLDREKIQLPFVGSHPMTGSDLTGPENSRRKLFQSATIYIVELKRPGGEKNDREYQQTIGRVRAFWKELGAHTYTLSREQHDRWGAYLSHGLHLISCLTSILVKDIPGVFDVPSMPTGGSFRDITRVAGSNPKLWEGIIQSNSKEIAEYLKRFVSVTNEWIEILEKNQMPVKDIFTEAQKIRDKMVKQI